MSAKVSTLAATSASPSPTEDQVARTFEQRHVGTLRYCHTRGRWFIWTGAHWREDTRREVADMIRQHCRAYAEAGQPKFGRAGVMAAVEKLAATAPLLAVDASCWDRDPWLLGTPAGTVDLRTGDLRPADPADMISRCTAVGPEPGDPKRWLQFLAEATGGDAAFIGFLQRLAGYALTGRTDEQRMFFLHGPGGNGKSIFMGVLAEILGGYAKTASGDTFVEARGERHPADIAALAGARLVTASEIPDGRRWDSQRLKSITGGDTISARFMGRDFFDFRPQLTLLVAANHRPRLAQVDDAMRRRLAMIPFVRQPEKPDPKLAEKLRDEHGKILWWAIRGCQEWRLKGLGIPPAVIEETADYFDCEDQVADWLRECCDAGPRYQELSAALFNSWRRFAEANGEHAGTAKALSAELKRRGFRQYRSKSGRGFVGIRVKPEPAMPDPRDPGAW